MLVHIPQNQGMGAVDPNSGENIDVQPILDMMGISWKDLALVAVIAYFSYSMITSTQKKISSSKRRRIARKEKIDHLETKIKRTKLELAKL